MEMDDNDATSAMEVEQTLLHQFSCLGTTDRDDLVNQLQRLLGKDINYSTASFFLDMNNWNLQGAICSYLDAESQCPLPRMTLISEPESSTRKILEPHTKFEHVWTISNTGSDKWPPGCYAEQCQPPVGLNRPGRIQVPCLTPGSSYRLVVDFVAPEKSAIYQSKWRLCVSDGTYFGETMWVIVEVDEERTSRLAKELEALRSLGNRIVDSSDCPNPFDVNNKQGL
ncbi:protein ILRUN [Coccinella septempunctata]|uniref:protein ILRUN n=1 Tax=Coccinella septempunctata TaxID=41139 RepID=UPI001D08472C|nr:protein ILRUN [Coccinella septempunctata]XP_044764133.1 protein ILRUN [Coccinella septempunctata]